MSVTPQNITGFVGRLTTRGLLQRRPHERHAHVLELHLTDAGSELLGRADRLVAGLEEQVLAALGDAADPLREALTNVRESVTPPT